MIVENPSQIFKDCFFIFEKSVFLMQDASLPSFETIQNIHCEYPGFYFLGEITAVAHGKEWGHRENSENVRVKEAAFVDGGERKNAENEKSVKGDEDCGCDGKGDENGKSDFCVLLADCEKKAAEAAIKYGLLEIPIRQFFFENDCEKSALLSRAKSLSVWGRKMRFCPECGGKLVYDRYESALFCPKCGNASEGANRTGLYFPRIEPCVIVLVERDGKILLVRHTYRNQDIFACVAGFIEAGENAEAAVFREVLEETGIKIKNIQYKGSQAWPFPDQLMLAFTAEYESGEFSLQKSEIAEAAWFSRSALPPSPKPGSVAYRLINGLF